MEEDDDEHVGDIEEENSTDCDDDVNNDNGQRKDSVDLPSNVPEAESKRQPILQMTLLPNGKLNKRIP